MSPSDRFWAVTFFLSFLWGFRGRLGSASLKRFIPRNLTVTTNSWVWRQIVHLAVVLGTVSSDWWDFDCTQSSQVFAKTNLISYKAFDGTLRPNWPTRSAPSLQGRLSRDSGYNLAMNLANQRLTMWGDCLQNPGRTEYTKSMMTTALVLWVQTKWRNRDTEGGGGLIKEHTLDLHHC